MPLLTNAFATGCMILAMAFFAGSDRLGRILTVDHHFPSLELLLFRAAIAIILVIAVILTRDGGFKNLKLGRPRLHLYRGLAWTASALVYILALTHADLTKVYVIASLAPFWAGIIGWRMFGKTFKLLLLPAMMVMFLGVAISSELGVTLLALAGVLAALAGFFEGLYFALNDELRDHSGPFCIMLTTSLVALICASLAIAVASAVLPGQAWRSISTLNEIGLIAANGFCGAVANLLVIIAFARASRAQVVTPFGYMLLPFGALADWLVQATIPGLPTLCGATMIVGGGLLLIACDSLSDELVRKAGNVTRLLQPSYRLAMKFRRAD